MRRVVWARSSVKAAMEHLQPGEKVTERACVQGASYHRAMPQVSSLRSRRTCAEEQPCRNVRLCNGWNSYPRGLLPEFPDSGGIRRRHSQHSSGLLESWHNATRHLALSMTAADRYLSGHGPDGQVAAGSGNSHSRTSGADRVLPAH